MILQKQIVSVNIDANIRNYFQVIAMPLSGVLAASLGWESLFYVFGKLQNILNFEKKNLIHYPKSRCYRLHMVRCLDINCKTRT